MNIFCKLFGHKKWGPRLGDGQMKCGRCKLILGYGSIRQTMSHMRSAYGFRIPSSQIHWKRGMA